jgi:cytochrome c551/c552
MTTPHLRALATLALMAGITLLLLSGCGASKTSSQTSSTPPEPHYTPEPLTHEQKLVEQGARLVISDGCSACHLPKSGQSIGPSFYSFAGQEATLEDGRGVLVDERFLREGILHPARSSIRGYDPAPMLAAMRRLHLISQPQQVSELIAFIEQVGPETAPG